MIRIFGTAPWASSSHSVGVAINSPSLSRPSQVSIWGAALTGMALKLGMKVRHPQFGIGTVLSVEALDDDTKLVVHFVNGGRKTLRAKFARLEPA